MLSPFADPGTPGVVASVWGGRDDRLWLGVHVTVWPHGAAWYRREVSVILRELASNQVAWESHAVNRRPLERQRRRAARHVQRGDAGLSGRAGRACARWSLTCRRAEHSESHRLDATRIIAIRHGETAWNADTRIQGTGHSAQRHRPVAGATRGGQALAGEPISAIYASDLQRADATAQRHRP